MLNAKCQTGTCFMCLTSLVRDLSNTFLYFVCPFSLFLLSFISCFSPLSWPLIFCLSLLSPSLSFLLPTKPHLTQIGSSLLTLTGNYLTCGFLLSQGIHFRYLFQLTLTFFVSTPHLFFLGCFYFVKFFVQFFSFEDFVSFFHLGFYYFCVLFRQDLNTDR